MPIACEVCGSIDVIKNESGLFVCKDCGAQYTIEAIREQLSASTNQNASEAVEEDSPLLSALSEGARTSERIVTLFNERAFEEASSVYEASPKDATISAQAHLFGNLASAAQVFINGGDNSDIATKSYLGMSLFITTKKAEADASDDEFIPELLVACSQSQTFLLGLWVNTTKALAETLQMMRAAGVGKEFFDSDDTLERCDFLQVGSDIVVRLAISEMNRAVLDGYRFSSESVDLVKRSYDLIKPYNRYPMDEPSVQRVLDSVNKESSVEYLKEFDTPTILYHARLTSNLMYIDEAYWLYTRILSVAPQHAEAKCIVDILNIERMANSMAGHALFADIPNIVEKAITSLCDVELQERVDSLKHLNHFLNHYLVTGLSSGCVLSIPDVSELLSHSERFKNCVFAQSSTINDVVHKVMHSTLVALSDTLDDGYMFTDEDDIKGFKNALTQVLPVESREASWHVSNQKIHSAFTAYLMNDSAYEATVAEREESLKRQIMGYEVKCADLKTKAATTTGLFSGGKKRQYLAEAEAAKKTRDSLVKRLECVSEDYANELWEKL